MSTSRIAVLQPCREGVILERLAQADPAGFENRAARLNAADPSFDLELRMRVVEGYIAHLVSLLERVGEANCNLVLLPECTLPLGAPEKGALARLPELYRLAESAWLRAISPLAARFQMLIASCYFRAEGDKLYNDGVLVDQTGDVAGIYHKVHLPCPLEWEMTEAGCFEAGNEHPVFETSVGNIGFQICYDIDFPEGTSCLALNGADIILHPTVGYNFPDEEELMGEARLRTRATDNSVVVAYANFGPSVGRSAIYAHNGTQVACCGRGEDVFCFADIDLRAPRMQNWGSYGTHSHRDQLARKRRPDTYGVLTEHCPPLLNGCERPDGRLYEYR